MGLVLLVTQSPLWLLVESRLHGDFKTDVDDAQWNLKAKSLMATRFVCIVTNLILARSALSNVIKII